jgi:hypothetical protein
MRHPPALPWQFAHVLSMDQAFMPGNSQQLSQQQRANLLAALGKEQRLHSTCKRIAKCALQQGRLGYRSSALCEAVMNYLRRVHQRRLVKMLHRASNVAGPDSADGLQSIFHAGLVAHGDGRLQWAAHLQLKALPAAAYRNGSALQRDAGGAG